jgi:hypothetical protein
MRTAYLKGRAAAAHEGVDPHVHGSVWGLVSRHTVRGIPRPDMKLMFADLAPCLFVQEEDRTLAAGK